jgi:single-stranded-DNA-specific exonuclease
MSSQWIVKDKWPDRQQFADRLSVSPLLAQILHNRGIEQLDQARHFLRPKLSDLHPPETLPGTQAAAELIAQAARAGRRIVIYGDYDVDGITATAILWHCLRLLGASVDFYIPHRLEEGYGLNTEAMEKLADDRAEVVITVDCGITAIEPVARARSLGLEVVVTDHHAAGGELPADCHIVHPTAVNGEYPNPHLCGAGVAFKLAWALARCFCRSQKVSQAFRDFLVEATGLAALGTIADVVPLVGENRVLAHFGLMGLRESRLPGLTALIDQSGLSGEKIDSYHVGFWLAPRLNAAGRMGHARLAVELLTRADEKRGAEIARFLDQQNSQRKQLDSQITEDAKKMAQQSGMTGDACRAIVLSGPWHAGVIGIVASRLVDQFCRPVVLIADKDPIAQGSARSIAGFSMYDALARCSEHLAAFGGHEMAAGLKIETQKIPAFTEAFCRHAGNVLTAAQMQRRLPLDGEVRLAELTEPVVSQIKQLGPFGIGNPRPKLATAPVELVGDTRIVGKTGQHLQLTVSDGSASLKAIAFRGAHWAKPLADHRSCRLAFEPIISEFNGRRSVELQVIDCRFPPFESG